MRTPRLIAVLLTAALAAGISACSSSGSSSGSTASEQVTPACSIEVPTDLATKPVPVIPNACTTPPSSLVTKIVVQGNGDVAHLGELVDVRYVGYAWSNKREFDEIWTGDKYYQFTIGMQKVIAGWDQALLDAEVGTRMLVVIPPNLAYGAAGGGPIGPNETLVFVIDVVGVGGVPALNGS